MTISHFHVFALIVSLHSTLSLSFYSTRTYILSLSLSLTHSQTLFYHIFCRQCITHLPRNFRLISGVYLNSLLTHCKNNIFSAFYMSQFYLARWIRLRLPSFLSCGRGFESQAHHLCFFKSP